MDQQNFSHPITSHPQAPKASKLPWVILAVIVVALAVFAIVFRDKLMSGDDKMQGEAKASGYQAVFLTNGQVYFGKLSEGRKGQYMLRDIFYLQVQNPSIQGSQEQSQQQEPKLSLIKLGEELHGPVDEMVLNKDHVLFYEDMKTDAKVVQKMLEYKANPTAANQQGAQQQGTQQAPAATPVPSATPAN